MVTLKEGMEGCSRKRKEGCCKKENNKKLRKNSQQKKEKELQQLLYETRPTQKILHGQIRKIDNKHILNESSEYPCAGQAIPYIINTHLIWDSARKSRGLCWSQHVIISTVISMSMLLV